MKLTPAGREALSDLVFDSKMLFFALRSSLSLPDPGSFVRFGQLLP